jgi:hypothetical protein
MQNSALADAKHRLRIPDLWGQFGFPGEPRKSCRCPFHDDRSASFSVSPDGLLWHCFARCGGGDAVDFLQRARGLSQADACREFLRLAGGGFGSTPYGNYFSPPLQRSPRRVQLDGATPGDETHWQALATRRNLSLEAVALAAQRGLLLFGTHKGHAAWLVTDSTRRNAQARRMDGQLWPEIGNKKAWTLSGSQATWPVSANEAAEFSHLAFCEGGPDLLSAFHFILCESREADCSAVAMLGASLDIHPDALSLFAGKCVRIFGHADPSGAGSQAVERWAAQLTTAAADVDAFNFVGLRKADGSPLKDLNDATSVCADDFEANRELWSLMP